MKEIKLAYSSGNSNKTITCFAPESWHEVLLKQYIALQKVFDNETLSTLEIGMHRASILTNVSIEVLEQCDFDEVLKLMGMLSFSSVEPKPELEKAITSVSISGYKYHPVQLYTMADLTAYDKIESAEEISHADKLAYKLAVFMRQELPMNQKWYQKLWPAKRSQQKPNLEAFTGDSVLVESRKKLFADNLTVNQVTDLAAFFLKAVVTSQLPSLACGPLAQALLRQNAKMEQLFGRVMAGNQPCGLFQKILWKMKHYHSCQSAKYLLG